MIIERPSSARGRVRAGWLDARHTFSFGSYHDPDWMGFGALRVINEDRISGGGGFAPHRHANMEIITMLLGGALAHRDSSGGEGVIGPGELQWMSAGHGVEHSEFNASLTEPAHLLQIWIQPDRLNAQPAYAQRAFDPAARLGRWAMLADPDGTDGALPIRQQASLRATRLDLGQALACALDPGRRYWLHVATGEVVESERNLAAGDALGFVGEAGELQLRGGGAVAAEVLLFDLPA